ncbi:type IV pilus biogenesis/stability protein PilW [Catenovulum sp. SM1970]|uniref:type IV pilus biogenesis/stability protein PilW n=1 Tax=Marinifaba aquimaris TaxID=2741323 RepID=UPI0015734E2D|nr:type IV pilus biogenesis/stability protein PilW [Marinifaba aquimaris]NTS75487.1 type IV pilus biogenesis/stability protein PilW [Marinifaba aquimaris]
MNKLPLFFVVLFTLTLSACVTETRYVGSDEPVNKTDVNPVEVAKTRMALGLQYIKVGNYSQAKFNLDKALAAAPNLPEVHYSLAYYYQIVNELDNANNAYKRVLELDPENGDALNNYGAFLCQNGKIVEAEQYFLLAVEQDDYIREEQTYVNLGVCLLEHGGTEKALGYFDKALSHNPYSGKALVELADYHFSQGDVVEAKNYLKRYERAAKLTARSLWLGYRIAEQQGESHIAKQYGQSLIRYHANSKEAQEYKQLLRQ